MTGHWTERAERTTSGDTRILGEDDNGEFWVPSRTRPEWWDRRFNPWNPAHWVYWLRSRRTKRIAFIERGEQ